LPFGDEGAGNIDIGLGFMREVGKLREEGEEEQEEVKKYGHDCMRSGCFFRFVQAVPYYFHHHSNRASSRSSKLTRAPTLDLSLWTRSFDCLVSQYLSKQHRRVTRSAFVIEDKSFPGESGAYTTVAIIGSRILA